MSIVRKVPVIVVLVAQLTCVGGGIVGGVCDIAADFGAIGDGETLNTEPIQRAIDDPRCQQVVVPEHGVFMTGAINLTSNLVFRVNGILRGSQRPEDYPVVPALPSYGEARDTGFPLAHRHLRHQAFIGGWHVRNATLCGTGVIDGNGDVFWAANLEEKLDYERPRLVEPMFCEDFRVFDLHLKDSAFWTLHPFACARVHVADVKVTAPRNERAPNTDGIDLDSCSQVLVERVYVDTGDNAMSIKSGFNEFGRAFARPTRDVLIRNSHFASQSVAIGSEMSGGIFNITFERCVFGDPFGLVWKAGFIIKSEYGRGGEVSGISVAHSVFHSMGRDPSGAVGMPPIALTMSYPGQRGTPAPGGRDLAPRIHNISFTNIIAHGSGFEALTGLFSGLTESPIQNIKFRNFTSHGPSRGWLCSRATGIDMDDTVTPSGVPWTCPAFPKTELPAMAGPVDCHALRVAGPMEARLMGCSSRNIVFQPDKEVGFLFGHMEASSASLNKATYVPVMSQLGIRWSHVIDVANARKRAAAALSALRHAPQRAEEPVVTWVELKRITAFLCVFVLIAMAFQTCWIERRIPGAKKMMRRAFALDPVELQDNQAQGHLSLHDVGEISSPHKV